MMNIQGNGHEKKKKKKIIKISNDLHINYHIVK